MSTRPLCYEWHVSIIILCFSWQLPLTTWYIYSMCRKQSADVKSWSTMENCCQLTNCMFVTHILYLKAPLLWYFRKWWFSRWDFPNTTSFYAANLFWFYGNVYVVLWLQDLLDKKFYLRLFRNFEMSVCWLVQLGIGFMNFAFLT